MKKFFSSEKNIKCFTFLLLLGLIGTIYFFHPEFFFEIWRIITSGNVNELVAYLNSFGIWAIIVSFLLDVLINALGFLPSIFISTANGVVFGLFVGVIVSWLAETVGVVISFFLMRTILREKAEQLISKSRFLTKLDDFSGEKGFQWMLIARTIPYFPSGLLTALGAVSRISPKDYILSNLIGKFPSTALETIIGHDAVLFEENMHRLCCVILCATAFYFLLYLYEKKHR